MNAQFEKNQANEAELFARAFDAIQQAKAGCIDFNYRQQMRSDDGVMVDDYLVRFDPIDRMYSVTCTKSGFYVCTRHEWMERDQFVAYHMNEANPDERYQEDIWPYHDKKH